jgi:hypothetical protein
MRRRGSLAALAALMGAAGTHRQATASVRVETSLQESVFDQPELESPNLTVGTGPQRLLLVTVATGDLAAQIQEVSWSGVRLNRFEARSLTVPEGPCRLELWMLLDPMPGTGPLLVSLSKSAGFGLGAVVYTGVDREAPFGPLLWQSGSGGRLSLELPAPGDRPVLGAACLGGAWTTGPTLTTPEAVPGPAQSELWNFVEPRVAGLGSHRLAMNGPTPISWDVTGSEPYQWLAVGVSIKPDHEILPDAGPDTSGDSANPAGDGPGERGMVLDTMAEPSLEGLDAEANDVGLADVHLRVGCACDLGARRRSHTALWLIALGLLTVGRRRRPS